MPGGEGGAVAQRERGVAPRQPGEAVRADAVEQGGSNGLRVGVGVGTARQAQRAEAAFAQRLHAAGGGIEVHRAVRGDPVAEQPLDRGEVDRCGGEDARARCHALRFRDGEPFLARQTGTSVELEPAPADRGPGLARSIATPRDAIGEGEGDGY